MLVVSTLLHARPQAQHLPIVGDYGTVLAYSVALDGDDAGIGTATGIAIVRIANPARIEKLSSIDTLSDSRCVVAGRHAYVVSSSDGLVVVDVSNRRSPRLVGRHRGTARYSDVKVAGRHAYAVVSTGGLDLSQATASTVVGEVAPEGRGGLIALLSGHLAVATDRGVCLYDISAPRTPVMRKLLPGRLSDIYSDGDRTLFVHSRELTTVLDLSNVDSPRVLGTIGAYFHDLARRGDLVFGVMTGLKVYRLGPDPRGE